MAADRPISPTFRDSNPQESKQTSGFTPLPPIRRTSTFDLLSRKKRNGDEEDGAPTSSAGPPDNKLPPPIEKDAIYQNGNAQIPSQGQGAHVGVHPSQSQDFVQPPPQQHPALGGGASQISNGFTASRGAHEVNGAQRQAFTGRGDPAGGAHHHFGQTHDKPSAVPVNSLRQPFVSQMGGNPIQKYPPGGQWKLEESHLSEPLKNRLAPNSPPQQQRSYDVYDKETEGPPRPTGQSFSQPRPRNNSGSIPPVSAERFYGRGIFAPHGPEQFQAQAPQQASSPVIRAQTNEGTNQGEDGHDISLNKEIDVHADEGHPGEDRRGSGFFSRTNRRNASAEQGSQNPEQPTPGKEKRSFLSTVVSHDKLQPKQKSNLGFPRTSTWDHDDGVERASMKKRLSELRGMIKGVGNAKDGAKDDQPAKPSNVHAPRPSIQGPTRVQTGLQGVQGSQGQPGFVGPQAGIGRSSASEPRPPHVQQAQSEDEKKSGGFLGSLFNKQASKPPESKQQPGQQTTLPIQRPEQFPMQAGQQFRPGPMPPPGQQLGAHPMYAGQPLVHIGHLGQQGLRQPIVPGQQNAQIHTQSPVSPQFLGTAQAVVIRRPSEITVSSQNQTGSPQQVSGQRPQMPSHQGPQTNIRPPARQDTDDEDSIKRSGGDESFVVSGGLPKTSPHLSERLSQDRLDVGGPSSVPRTSPNRKPVGSGFPKQDTQTPHPLTNMTKPDGLVSQHQGPQDERRLSSHPPSGQQSPTLGKLGHVRQTSLPSPGHPAPPLRSNQVTPQTAPDRAQLLPLGPIPPQNRQQIPAQPQGVSQGLPGQSPTGSLPSPPGASSQYNIRPNPQAWVTNNAFPSQQRPGPPPRSSDSPAKASDQQSIIANFFGSNSKSKTVSQGQATKEKSAASKLLGAFKRGSKQSEPDQPNQQRPPPGHQILSPSMRTQQSGHPQQLGRPPISSPSPAGPLGPMSSLPQSPIHPGLGRGQMPPPTMLGSHNQMLPPMNHGAGRGQLIASGQKPPQAQGPQPPILGQPRRASTQNFEPQYDQVPIPRGYQAVHGYGNAGTIAPSPYDVGRPSPPPAPHQQFQSLFQQGKQPQWDPRLISAQQSGIPYGQQILAPQANRHSPSQTDSGTPTPSEKGTFLDMTPTPPPQPAQEEYQFDGQPNQNPQLPQLSRPHQAQTQANYQYGQNADTQTPSSSNWSSAPDSTQNLHLQRRQDAPIHGTSIQSRPSDPNISPPSDSGDNIQPSQPQHIATAMSNQHPPVLQPRSPPNDPLPNTAQLFSPVHSQPKPEIGLSPPPAQGPEDRANASRLVSKMSAASEAPRSTLLSPEIITNRAASVSPEPPGLRPAPYHQVSNASLNANVDRANDHVKVAEEDIYDATPRINAQARMQGPSVHENTKYAGSEKGRAAVNGGAMVAGVGIGASVIAGSVVVDAAAQSGSDSEDGSPPQTLIPVQTEPEEKILVDQPVELAAVNDDDDGIPVMSATSYPGQEWNPYGAGEFGDWD
ncbi:hypothetical protein AAE478_009056 [Parahypoxylon ruwenzoriense]